MTKCTNPPRIPLPADWSQHARSVILHVIPLAQFALAYTRGWAVNSQVARVRLKAENDRLRQQAAWLTEEIRIKDARMRLVAAQRRPHYAPTERMSILELRAARACISAPRLLGESSRSCHISRHEKLRKQPVASLRQRNRITFGTSI